MKLPLFLFVCAVFSSNALRAGTTTAEVVYSNYDTIPGTGTGLSITNADAVSFTDNLTAPLDFAWALNDVQFYFKTSDNNQETGLSSNPVTVSLYGNANGVPGTLLDSVTVQLDSTVSLADVTFSDLPQMQTGQEYWLALSDPVPNDLEWYQATNEAAGVAFSDGSAWTYHDSYTQGAVQVGAIEVSATPTPEPGTFLALGSGLLLLLRKRR
jgi:hypothetical protein